MMPPTSTPTQEPTPTAEPRPYYTQSVDVDGISVKASQTVDPKALEAGAETVRVTLAHRPDIARRMAEAGAALAIVPKSRYITEIPELGYLKGRLDLNGNPYDSFAVRGSGGIPQQPTTVTSEENLLGLVEDRAGSGQRTSPSTSGRMPSRTWDSMMRPTPSGGTSLTAPAQPVSGRAHSPWRWTEGGSSLRSCRSHSSE